MNVFGPVVTGADVRSAARATIQLWSPDYLAEISERSGRERGALPRFRSYVSALDLDKFDEDQVPACVIVAPGLISQPRKHGAQWEASWALSVGCVVSGQNRENTFELTELYAAAIRTMVLQHPSLSGVASGIDWLGERYDELTTDDLRTIAAGIVQFSVTVETVADRTFGLQEPTIDPDVDPPVTRRIESVHIDTSEVV